MGVDQSAFLWVKDYWMIPTEIWITFMNSVFLNLRLSWILLLIEWDGLNCHTLIPFGNKVTSYLNLFVFKQDL